MSLDLTPLWLPLAVETKGVNRQLQAAGQAGGGVFSQAFSRATGSGMTRGIKQASRDVGRSMDELAGHVKTYETAQRKAADAAGKARVAYVNLNQVQNNSKSTAVQKAAAEERNAKAMRDAKAAADTLKNAEKALQDQHRNLGSTFGRPFQQGGGDSSGGGMMGMMLLGRGGLAGISRLSGTAGTLAGTAMKAGIAGVLGVGAAAAILAPFVAGFKAFDWAATVGMPLDRTMNEFKGVTGASASEMAAMGNQARMLGSDIHLAGTTASDAAKAMTELAKSGFTTQQSIDASRATVQLATAGQIEAAQAAEIVGTAINTFGLNATDAQTVVDDFAATVMGSAADIPDLALALQMGGAAAHGFGINMQDTLATLGTFAQMGIKSSDAGTLMKTSLLAWQNASEPQQAAMEKLNLHLSDAQGNFVGYRNMLEQLAVASKNMTQAEFNEAAATVYGSDAFRAAMLAKGEAIPTFDRIRGELDKEGQAARMAGAQMEGLPGIVEGVSNTMDGLKLSVYDAGSAIATALGREGLDVFSSFAGWVGQHQPQIVGFFTGLGTAAVGGMAQMMSAVETGADVLAGFVNVIGDTLGGIQRAYAWSQRLLGRDEEADKADALADSMFGWSDGLEAVVKKAGDAENKLIAFQGKLQTAGDQANNAAKATRDLGGAMAQASEVDTVLKAPTPEQLAAIDAAKFKIEAIPGTKDFKVIANTYDAAIELNALREQQGQKPIEPPVKPKVAEGDAQMRSFIDTWSKAIIAPPVNPTMPPPPATPSLNDMLNPGGDNGPQDGLTPGAVAMSDYIRGKYGLATISGWRPKVRSWDEHQTGKAIDIGIPDYKSPAGVARGNAVLNEMLRNPNVKHVIWRQAIYTVGGGAKPMEDRGDDNQNHFNHLHILMKRLGGSIPGSGSGDRVPVLAEPGEHMFARRDVDAMGGQAAVYDFRRALHRQTGGAIGFPWDEVAKYESSGNWQNADTGNNGHYGGLQFSPSTWLAFGGGEFAPMPHQATREQQIIVADRTAFTGYKGTKPQGLGAWEVITKGMVPGVTTSTPRGAAPGAATTGGLDFVSRATGGAPTTTPTGTPGIGPNGVAGTYQVDPEKVAAAEKRIRDADEQVKIEEQQIRELDAEAKESQRMAANDQLRRAKEDAAEARAELDKAKQGEFKEGETGTGTGRESATTSDTNANVETFGGDLVSGLLQGLGFDGELFSDPTQWGIWKLFTGAANWGAKFMDNLGKAGTVDWSQGGQGGGGGGFGLGVLNGVANGLGIQPPGTSGSVTQGPGLSVPSAVSATAQPGSAVAPATTVHGGGAGALPGPGNTIDQSVNFFGPVNNAPPATVGAINHQNRAPDVGFPGGAPHP